MPVEVEAGQPPGRQSGAQAPPPCRPRPKAPTAPRAEANRLQRQPSHRERHWPWHSWFARGIRAERPSMKRPLQTPAGSGPAGRPTPASASQPIWAQSPRPGGRGSAPPEDRHPNDRRRGISQPRVGPAEPRLSALPDRQPDQRRPLRSQPLGPASAPPTWGQVCVLRAEGNEHLAQPTRNRAAGRLHRKPPPPNN